jgi:TRAP-type C4-dicarboxylate transport system permease small subunit
MAALVARLGELGSWLAGASLLSMMLIGAIDIIGTKLVDRPLPGTFELTEALMVLGVFLALAHTQARRQHIAVDLVTRRLGRGARGALDLFARLLTLGVFALIAWQGWVLGLGSLRVREYAPGIVQFPLYPSKLALAVGATLMVLQSLVDVLGAERADAPDR